MRLFRRKKKEPIRNEAWYAKALGVTSARKIVDDVADLICRKCMMYGIRGVDVETHNMSILFNNDIEFYFWNSNRYYAWMSNGKFTDLNENKILYQWSDGQPSCEAMWMLKNMITVHYGSLIAPTDLTMVYQTLKKYEEEHFIPNEIEHLHQS